MKIELHYERQTILTVVVCTFNADKYLRGCLDSIVFQKMHDVRLHVIDGQSSDATLDIIKSYQTNIDYWLSEKDEGVYDAMNKAVAGIKSGWILFLGADDRIMPNTLARICGILRSASNANTLFYGDVYRPALNKLYDGEFSIYKLMRRNICQQAIIYPIEALRKCNFDTRYYVNADHILNMQLFLDGILLKKYVPVCISYFEDIADGISRDKSDLGFLAARRKLALDSGGVALYLFSAAIDFKERLRRMFFR